MYNNENIDSVKEISSINKEELDFINEGLIKKMNKKKCQTII